MRQMSLSTPNDVSSNFSHAINNEIFNFHKQCYNKCSFQKGVKLLKSLLTLVGPLERHLFFGQPCQLRGNRGKIFQKPLIVVGEPHETPFFSHIARQDLVLNCFNILWIYHYPFPWNHIPPKHNWIQPKLTLGKFGI